MANDGDPADGVVAPSTGAKVFARLKRELASARGGVTKTITRARAAMEGDVTVDSTSDVRACQGKLMQYRDRMNEVIQQLEQLSEASVEFMDDEQVKQADYEDRLDEIDLDIEAYLRKNDPESFREETSRSRAHSNSIQHDAAAADINESRLQSTMTGRPGAVKLTPWKEFLHRVPKFDGDPTKFRRWQGAFETHIDSSEMLPQEKFELLLKTLTGRALKALHTREVTAENYEGARDKIYEKFCDRELARQGHLRNVYSICARRDIDRGTRFIEFVEDLILNVESLAINGDTYEGMSLTLHSTILQALSYNRRSKFMDYFTERQRNGDGDCKLQVMMDFLEEEVKKVEALMRAEQEYMAAAAENQYRKRSDRFEKKADHIRRFEEESLGSDSDSDSNRVEHPEGRRFFSSTATNDSSDQDTEDARQETKSSSCIFCAGEHNSNVCQIGMSREDRRDCVIRENACFKCLSRSHRARRCRARIKCSICGVTVTRD